MSIVRKDTITKSARTVLIAQNPRSGSSNRTKLVQQLAAALQSADMSVQIVQDIEQLTDAANDAFQAGDLRTVVSAGGDGTVSLLVNRLRPEIPFFVFPLGTANLLAKYLKTSRSVEAAVNTIVGGKIICLDVGKANGQIFLVVASCGYDADVVHRIHATRRGHISYASYFFPVVQSIWGYKFPGMKLVADGRELGPAKWAFVLNIPEYAVGLKFVPDTNGQDGKLDVCTFANGGFLTGLGYFFSVLFRRHERLATARFERFQTLEILPVTDMPVPVELDGDPAGFLPLKIEAIPQRLRVLVNDDWRP